MALFESDEFLGVDFDRKQMRQEGVWHRETIGMANL